MDCAGDRERNSRAYEAGVKFKRYEWMEQDELGVWTCPPTRRLRGSRDPDGNTLSLTEFGAGEEKVVEIESAGQVVGAA